MSLEEKNSKTAVYKWLTNPSSWISLSAAVISITSFYLVYADKGTIKVLLPYGKNAIGIGISAESNDLDFLVHGTLSNTGAPRTTRYIRSITGRVHSLDKTVPLDGTADWTYENKLLGHDEFLLKYPNTKDKTKPDYLDYVSRALPFSLVGGQSTTKLMELELAGAHPAAAPAEFQFTLTVHTETGDFSDIATYECPKVALTADMAGTTNWCRAVVAGQ